MLKEELKEEATDVVSRTLCGFIFCSLVLCGAGVLIDLDHWYAHVEGTVDGRWLHYTLASSPVVLLLLCVFWGIITTAFALRWHIVK